MEQTWQGSPQLLVSEYSDPYVVYHFLRSEKLLISHPDFNHLFMDNIMVIGAAGQIGSELVVELRKTYGNREDKDRVSEILKLFVKEKIISKPDSCNFHSAKTFNRQRVF